MRKIHCVRCGKPINEGEDAVRRKHFTGFTVVLDVLH